MSPGSARTGGAGPVPLQLRPEWKTGGENDRGNGRGTDPDSVNETPGGRGPKTGPSSEAIMGQLIVRDLDDRVIEALKTRAAPTATPPP
jgi:hypothetical protein